MSQDEIALLCNASKQGNLANMICNREIGYSTGFGEPKVKGHTGFIDEEQ